MFRVENLQFTYREEEDSRKSYRMFDNLSFQVGEGEFLCMIGPSGCGKSTLLRLLNHLEKPESGSITIDGKCAYMPQKDLLFPWRKAWENVALPLEMDGLSAQERKKKSIELLKSVGLAEWAEQYPRELSGGMRQRVAFARTLATGADVLLLDEPFSALDWMTRMELQEWLIEQWQKWKKTIVFVTHDVEEAMYLSQRILVMRGNPVKDLTECKIEESYPRNRDLMQSEDGLRCKHHLLTLLHSEGGDLV